nr:SAM-dependent methyltransferase [Saccharopolyspora karakumensis]
MGRRGQGCPGHGPECVDIARQNRRFLYRAVRYLVQEAGISQFLDMGCGLPTDNNVHEVAQAFDPSARVVYVDIDPIVLAHGRALLADNDATTVITADMRTPEAVVDHPATRNLIDSSQPVAVLYLSVGHGTQEQLDLVLRDEADGARCGGGERGDAGAVHLVTSLATCTSSWKTTTGPYGASEGSARRDQRGAHVRRTVGSGVMRRAMAPVITTATLGSPAPRMIVRRTG